jgi:S1-C subfamily serine protease
MLNIIVINALVALSPLSATTAAAKTANHKASPHLLQNVPPPPPAPVLLDPKTQIVKVYGHLKVKDNNGFDGSQGTGWFISDSILITDYHVIKDCYEILVVWSDGRRSNATVRNANADADLVALEVSSPRVNQAYLSIIPDSDVLSQGDQIAASGYPNDTWATSSGTIDQVYYDPSGHHIVGFSSTSVQTDFGGSGSPVLNSTGQVVGIVEGISKPGVSVKQEIFLSANVLWDALSMTNSMTHPVVSNTGVTEGLHLNQAQG